MQTAEHLDANTTASERDRLFAELLDGPVQPGDVDAMIEALKGAVAVAKPTPEAVPSRAVPTENASEFPTSRESCKPSAGACAIVGTAVFLIAAEAALNAQSPKFQHVAMHYERAFTAA